MEDHLHNEPKTLHDKVQAAIDKHTEADNIYLLYGHCGQALCGVQARSCPVILPKAEDCIDVLLADNDQVAELRHTAYFVSPGWLWGEENSGYEYDRIKAKHGEKRAMRVIRAMYKNYEHLLYINTGLDEDRVRTECAQVADKLGLELKETTGGVDVFLDMLAGAVDSRYLIILPGESITEDMFRK